MERRAKMEMFEQIRRKYADGESIAALAREYGIHRRMVRQALANAIPPGRKKSIRKQPKIDAVKPFIDEILEGDLVAPRKQRHTAERIHQRIRQEFPEHVVSSASVRRYVARKKRELGLKGREVFVPQSYQVGVEAQVDWFEATAVLGGVRLKVQMFAMRSMYSGGAFHCAYRHATQQAFLEAHEKAFHYFGGVFAKLRYDNLGSAVKKILRGRQRVETERWHGFRSHWGYEGSYCNPARGNEKGGVEGEGGWYRRNWLVPVPEAEKLEALNQHLYRGCLEMGGRVIAGRATTIGAAMDEERRYLRPLVAEGFEIEETTFPQVDGKGCVKVKGNSYSTPCPPGVRVMVKVWPSTIAVCQDGKCVARHERAHGRGYQVLDLEHYLDVLEKKPGAMAGSTPLAQWRQAGRWTENLDRMWARLQERHGVSGGTREMIALVRAGQASGWEKLQTAVDEALRLGSTDAGAVLYLLHMPDPEQRRRYELALKEELAQFERPMPVMTEYDELLSGGDVEVIQ
jgi:transposase